MIRNIHRLVLGCIGVLFMSGCFGPKYIPSSYFLKRHDMKVAVKPIPEPVHLEMSGPQSSSLVEDLVKGAVSSSREADMKKVFAHIDGDEVRSGLEVGIGEKIKEYYNVKSESKDLVVEIQITSWGWILPTGAFGIRTGSYYMQMSGKVVVYDDSLSRKEIGSTYLTTKEEMKDNMSPEETMRRVKGQWMSLPS